MDIHGEGGGPVATGKTESDRLTYGSYLRVPDLLALQSPLRRPPVHGEMLFIVVQQAQELWFKQILHELRLAIDLLQGDELPEATHVLDRVDRIMHVLCEEVEILESLPPIEFQAFRGLLKTASGFESEQFRELELASGLRRAAHLKLAERLADVPAIVARWPVSLHDAFLLVVARIGPEPIEVLVDVYAHPSDHADVYRLAEALSDYEMRFREWRFHHMTLVQRVIGDEAPGTGGSPGSRYLQQTLDYHFFPELWEARNRLLARPPTTGA